MFCSYGCGNKAKYKFKNGKYCCSKNWQSCEIYRLQRKKITTRLMKDKNIIEKISKANKNKTAWNKGKKLQYQVWNKGKTGVYSEETLNKIAKFSKGRKGYWTGRKRSYETIKKIIKNHRDVSGPNNPSWKGGISCEPYCDVWLDKEMFPERLKDAMIKHHELISR